MPIQKENFGVHEDVTFLRFGSGDILFTRARNIENKYETMLLFSSQEPRSIGDTTDDYKGLSSDEIPSVKVVMSFTDPRSISALIHSLVELQKEVFDYKKSFSHR